MEFTGNHITDNLDQAINDQESLTVVDQAEDCALCLEPILFSKQHEIVHEGKKVKVCTWCMNHHNDDAN